MDNKDVIIAAQEVRIQQLAKQVIDLQKLVEELRDEIARLKKDSSNSSNSPFDILVSLTRYPAREYSRSNRILQTALRLVDEK